MTNVDYFHDVWYQEALFKLSLEHVEENAIDQTKLQIGLAIDPNKLTRSLNNVSKLLWKEKFLRFANFYKVDMPHYKATPDEFHLWEQSCKTFKRDHPNTSSWLPWLWKSQSGLKNSCNITSDLLLNREILPETKT